MKPGRAEELKLGAPPSAIPHTVSPHLCIDFVNSRFANHTGNGEVYDRLYLVQWQQWFCERAGVLVASPPTRAVYRDLVMTRQQIRDLLESQAEPDSRTLRWINQGLARGPEIWELRPTAAGLRMEVTRPPDWYSVIAAVLQSYGELLTTGQLNNVRRCANPDCTFLFHDQSRNASRRWCDPAMCGNLQGVRRHRQRMQG